MAIVDVNKDNLAKNVSNKIPNTGLFIFYSYSYFLFYYYCKIWKKNIYHTCNWEIRQARWCVLFLAAVFVYDNEAFNDAKGIGFFPKEYHTEVLTCKLIFLYTDLIFYLILTDLIERYWLLTLLTITLNNKFWILESRGKYSGASWALSQSAACVDSCRI